MAIDHRDYGMRLLKELVRSYECLVQDSSRVMNRLKAIYGGCAITCKGHDVYRQDRREAWLKQLPEPGLRLRARSLYAVGGADALAAPGQAGHAAGSPATTSL